MVKKASKKTYGRTSKKASFKAYKSKTFHKSVSRIAKAVINRDKEVKEVWAGIGMVPSCLQATTSELDGNLYNLTPSSDSYSIVQGVESDQRIGNSVKVKKAILSLNLAPYGYNATYNPNPFPTMVRVYLFKRKNKPTSSLLASDVGGSTADFFEYDGQANMGFQGVTGDMLKTVNKEHYTLMRYFTYKVGFQNASYQGSVNQYEAYANNDYKLSILKKINITNQFPKNLVWDDSTTPTASVSSPWLYMLVQVVNAVGTTTNATYTPVLLSGSLHLQYTDA